MDMKQEMNINPRIAISDPLWFPDLPSSNHQISIIRSSSSPSASSSISRSIISSCNRNSSRIFGIPICR
ncbi:hypothetical protein RchiOBHm_Chr7g0188891 [Rosa chinensis]|uniref:Uncharacterized protein n=1 Tax=Rosa chinensis TaxID=74649 RepID=A0A2P6P4K6_ROSCH|nr:hypothetical protein RchiOBHm_Chr7g0188891 [Rosa chinensis]